jgi:hypothetical protein
MNCSRNSVTVCSRSRSRPDLVTKGVLRAAESEAGHGVAELPPSAVLLGDCPRGRCIPRQREAGVVAADEIFGAGRELLEAIRSNQPGRAVPLAVGVSNAVPKLVV